jgi:hypothetical protein
MAMRNGHHAEMQAEDFAADVHHLFARNWRFWIFVWPVAELPLPIARAVHAVLRRWNRLTRMVQGAARHWLKRPRYLQPKSFIG